MSNTLKISAERSEGHWLMWLDQIPTITFTCDTLEDGVLFIMTHFGPVLSESDVFWEIDEITTEASLAFALPLQSRSRIPAPSLN